MTKAFHLSVKTPEEMKGLGVLIGRHLKEGSVVGLIGPLGAGKTTMAGGIAEGLGISEGYVVSSPTYTIMQIYPCSGLELYHLDLYRISGMDDLDSTGYRDASGKGKVLVVEWPDREPAVLPDENLQIWIRYSDNERMVSMVSIGTMHDQILQEIVESRALTFLPGFVDSE